MQRNTPRAATPLSASRPKHLCGLIGELLALFIWGVGALLFLSGIVLRVIDLGGIISIPLLVLATVSPYLALVGGILCLIQLFFATESRWATLIALFGHLAVVLFTISTFLVAKVQLEARVAQGEKYDEALSGLLDRKKGTYEAPENLFKIDSPSLRGALIIDQHDEKKHHVNVLVTIPQSPRLMFEIAPQAETGVPANASQEEFVEFGAKKVSADTYSERIKSPVGPALRVSFNKRGEDRSVNRWLTDNFVLNGWWMRVSAYTLASEDPEADRKELAKFLEEVWKQFSFNPPLPPEIRSKPPAFDVPSSLANPLDQEKYIKVPESATLPTP